MKDLLSKFKDGDFQFKEPWRAGKSLAIIVPIVARKAEARNYVLLEEVQEKVSITDTGRIGGVEVKGEFDKPIFIRGGTLLKGGTQERATEFSVVIAPGTVKLEVPVHCVHASKAIRPGASFTLASSYTPLSVHSSIMAARNQTVTWRCTASYSMSVLPQIPISERLALRQLSLPKHDDLVSVQESLVKFRRDLEEMLKQIPEYINQVGSVVIDPDGVAGLEMFNHPESWKAVSEKVKKTYTEALLSEDKAGIFKPDLDAALALINGFLEKLERVEEREVFNQKNARTAIFQFEGYVGEYTTLNDETIHLTVTRKQRQPESIQRTAELWRENWERRMRRGREVLYCLEQPKTWTNLTSELKMSKATLSTNLKKFQDMGLVEKWRGSNGVTRYSLTALGLTAISGERWAKKWRSFQ